MDKIIRSKEYNSIGLIRVGSCSIFLLLLKECEYGLAYPSYLYHE